MKNNELFVQSFTKNTEKNIISKGV